MSVNSPLSCPRTVVCLPCIFKSHTFSPPGEVVDAHWEAVRTNGQGIHASQSVSLLELSLAVHWRRHHVSVHTCLPGSLHNRAHPSPVFSSHTGHTVWLQSIRLIVTLVMFFFSDFILTKGTLKFQILHLEFSLRSKVPKKTCKTYFLPC